MSSSTQPTAEQKIADALRAAPAYITETATVVDWDLTTVLRAGSSDWTCVPTFPGKPASAPMCADQTTMQWFKEVSAGTSPTIDRIGISYMLMGEVGADFDHPEATQPPEGKDWYHAGPHVMCVFPSGTGHILQDLGTNTDSGLPYARPMPGAEPLLVVPVAKPGEQICACPSTCSCDCQR